MAESKIMPSALELVATMPAANRAAVIKAAKLAAHAVLSRAWEGYEIDAVLDAVEQQSKRLDERDAAEVGLCLEVDALVTPDAPPVELAWRPTDALGQAGTAGTDNDVRQRQLPRSDQ